MRVFLILSALPIVAAAAGTPLNADLDTLLKNSPFSPAAGGAVTRSAGPAKVEFRGYVRESDGYLFSLFDVAASKGSWAKLNERADDFLVKNFDEKSEVVTIEFQGQTLSLPLKEAKIQDAPLQVAEAPPPPPVPGANVPKIVTGNSADDARRLEQVAAEVRRRRALRQAATPNGSQ